MKVGILGSGTVGQELGKGFIREGYEVMIGTREPKKLSEWIDNVGEKGEVGSFRDAATFGEIIVLATQGVGTMSAIQLAGEDNFKGKVVIDVTNPLDFSLGMPPKLDSAPKNSLGEKIQKQIPDARVVKAFNTISAYIMCNPKREEGEPDLFMAGNDESAKITVTKIAKDFGWKSVIDIGDLSQAYLLEAFAMLWINYGFKNNHWAHAFKLMKK